jgi:nucleotide-binding universal stress UspA family protein
LEAIAAPFIGRDLSVSTKTLVGRPWLELIREVLRNQHDLVIKDVESKGGDGGIFRPHMDMRLLRKCPCPVWLVKSQARRFRRIAAAVDVFPADSATRAFCEKIVQLAASIAADEESELQIVCVWSVYAESVLKYKMPLAELKSIRETTKEAVAGEVENLLPACGGDVQPHVRLLEGDAEIMIPQMVEKEHEDLVVMGTVARAGLAGALIGNTAEKILKHLDCSLLAVKPDGFISPVRVE